MLRSLLPRVACNARNATMRYRLGAMRGLSWACNANAMGCSQTCRCMQSYARWRGIYTVCSIGHGKNKIHKRQIRGYAWVSGTRHAHDDM